MTYPVYTTSSRKDWIQRNLGRIEDRGLSYREIAYELKHYFGLPKPVSPATITRDLAEARKLREPNTMSEEARLLLAPENFPAWRELLFKYQTSKTQHALFYILRSLALKEDLPDWVIAHFELPEDINNDIVEKEKLLTFILLLAPRMGKTMTMVHGLINLYCDNPDLRVIYCQGIATTTEDINGLIMIEMEDNEKLTSRYGPFRHDDRPWSRQDGFILARRTRHSITPSFLPVGITSNVRSRDADIIVIDDPQDITRAESEATTTKDYRKITTEFMTRREPHTPVLMVGSHLPTESGDVFTQLEENLEELQTEGQAIILRKRKAHDEENCLVWAGEATEHWECLEWPEYRDFNFLMAQRALLGEEMFEAVYQQEAQMVGSHPFPAAMVKARIEDGGILDEQRSWREPLKRCGTVFESGVRCNGTLYTCMGFDPAAGESKRASYSAAAVIQGCIKCRTLYLLDYWYARQSPDRNPGTIERFARSYKLYYVRIEINAYQKSLARDKDVREAERKYKFHIDEWNTDDRKNTPEFGIPMVSKYMRDGLFSVPAKTDTDQEFGRELLKSFIRYPKKPNDIPMAVWLAAGAVWLAWEVHHDESPIYLPGRDHNVPAYMIDDPLRINLADYVDDDDMEDSGEYWALETVELD